jgi:hypothetical protein
LNYDGRVKTLLTLSIFVAFLALYISVYFRHDCGEPSVKVSIEKNISFDGVTQRIRVETTSTPRKDWRGYCYLTVRTERKYVLADHYDESKTAVATRVFKMKPGPMTLVESK